MKRISYLIMSFSVFSVFATHAENTSTVAPGQNNADVKVLSIEEELSLLDKDFQQLEKQLQVSINEQVALPPSINDPKKEVASASKIDLQALPFNQPQKEVATAFETEVQALPEDSEQLRNVSYEQDEIVDDDIALIDELEEDPLTDDTDDLFEEMLSDQQAEKENAITDPSPVSVSNEKEAEIVPVIMFEPQEESLLNEKPAAIAINNKEDLQPEISAAATKTVKEAAAIEINLHQVFSGSPAIYSILLFMSIGAVFIWLYSILSLRSLASIPTALHKNLHNKLSSNHFHEALDLCSHNNNIFCKMIASGIASRSHGLPAMLEAMKAEGKRASVTFWQRVGLLNDIAIIAPMLGLLGTVLGMFYAFYDINRSIESVSTLFDGLGISVGTTVAGLIVAIVALILQSLAKFRIVKALATVENEAQSMATLIDDRTSLHKN